MDYEELTRQITTSSLSDAILRVVSVKNIGREDDITMQTVNALELGIQGLEQDMINQGLTDQQIDTNPEIQLLERVFLQVILELYHGNVDYDSPITIDFENIGITLLRVLSFGMTPVVLDIKPLLLRKLISLRSTLSVVRHQELKRAIKYIHAKTPLTYVGRIARELLNGTREPGFEVPYLDDPELMTTDLLSFPDVIQDTFREQQQRMFMKDMPFQGRKRSYTKRRKITKHSKKRKPRAK